jgi:hypothetical protein
MLWKSALLGNQSIELSQVNDKFVSNASRISYIVVVGVIGEKHSQTTAEK